MSAEWKPGDVAIIVGHSRHAGKRAMFCDDGIDRRAWAVASTDGTSMAYGRKELRPLAVIDPEDEEAVERLLTAYLEHGWTRTPDDAPIRTTGIGYLQAALREFAAPKPPRPEEPGTWGVVEAACCHDDRRRNWVRHLDGNWYPVDAEDADDWDSLVDPVLVRDGVAVAQ